MVAAKAKPTAAAPPPPSPPPPRPPEAPSAAKKGFIRRVVPFFLAANVFVGAYVLVRTYNRDSEKETGETSAPASAPTATIPETTVPPAPKKILPPISGDEQRQLYKWILEEKRKVKPHNAAEKKKIDEEKALLKEVALWRTVSPGCTTVMIGKFPKEQFARNYCNLQNADLMQGPIKIYHNIEGLGFLQLRLHLGHIVLRKITRYVVGIQGAKLNYPTGPRPSTPTGCRQPQIQITTISISHSRKELEGFCAAEGTGTRRMPGCIHVSAIKLPVTSLFLKVAVGNREYNGSIGEGNFSFPVMSIRGNLVMMLYSADGALISQTELKTKAVVEAGNWDVTFDGGGDVVLRLQFLLSDEERERIREMRNSALKRKQQKGLRDGHGIPFTDSPPCKQHIEKVSNNSSKGTEPALRRSLSLDDLQERAVFSGEHADLHRHHSRSAVSQSGGRNSFELEDLIDIHKRKSKAESKSVSSVKKMISAFKSSLSQSPTPMTRIKSESSLRGMSSVMKSVYSEQLSKTGLQTNLELLDSLSSTKQEGSYLDLSTWRRESGAKSNLFANQKNFKDARDSQKSVKPSSVTAIDHGSCTSDYQHAAELRNIKGSTSTPALLEARKYISTKSLYNAASASRENKWSAASDIVDGSLISTAVGTSGDRVFASRSHNSIMFICKELNASEVMDPIGPDAGPVCSPLGGGDGATKQDVGGNACKSLGLDLQMVSRGKRQSSEADCHLPSKVLDRSIFISDPRALEHNHATDPAFLSFSRKYCEHPMNYVFRPFNIWMQPRLCITTGSRQLRDLCEHASAFTYTQRLDESMCEKKDSGNHKVKRFEITGQRTDGVSMLNGWLINQGVRVVIVIIACGAIFLN